MIKSNLTSHMKVSQKTFLGQFDQPLRKHVINFCNVISATKYDVYILLARKAACFIDSLIEIDLIEINGLIVSDRVLEYNADWLKGKTVAIIDDTIISGTSIYKLIKKLNKLQIKEIDVYAFCINEFWFVEDMLNKEDGSSYLKRPYLKLDHTSSLRFCKHIVDALSLAPRPYNIDFPIYERIKFTNSKLEKLYASNYWRIVNTSSSKQIENDILCCTINPTKQFTKIFNERVGWKINDVAHFKLRLYAQKKTDQNSTTYISKIVPYIIFNPISIKNANKIIAAICTAEHISATEINRLFYTDTSKLIFIQFYYAEKLFDTWLECTRNFVDLGTKFVKNMRSLYFLFTPEIIKTLAEMSKSKPSSLELVKELFLVEHPSMDRRDTELNPTSNLHNLINPFLQLYYEKELPARRIVKRLGESAFEDTDFIDIVNRLEDGISVQALKHIISKNVSDISDINQILSLFLDTYVDNGVIVPITVSKNGYLYRGYRHGEEVPWGNYNNRLLGKYFQRYLENIDTDELTQTYFQKLLVIFVKIGLKEDILEEYSTSTPRNLKTRLLSIKAHLFGMVSDYTELQPLENKEYLPIIDAKSKSYWTSKFLEDLGLISLNSKNNYVFDFDNFDTPYINEMELNEPSDLDESDLDKVSEIADVFGLLRKNKLLDEESLVLLTSCVNLHDNTASLAAELQIFLNSIEVYKYKITSNLNSSFTVKRLKDLRDIKQNYLWTAVNSGYFKYKSYSENRGLSYIQKITEYFTSENKEFEARAWKRYWRSEIDLSKNEENDLDRVNQEMGNLLLEVNITLAIIHQLIFEFLYRGKHLTQYLEEIDEHIHLNKDKISEIDQKISQIRSMEHHDVDLNNIAVTALGTERINVDKVIRSKTKEKKYWQNYADENLSFIETVAGQIFKGGGFFKNSSIYGKVATKQYLNFKNPEISKLINESLSVLSDLEGEIKKVMDDYKLTVPEWGKVQRKVRYNTFIHINSNVAELSKREEISKIIKHHLSEFEIEEFSQSSENKTINLLRSSDAKIGDGQIIGLRGQFTIDRMIKLSCKLLTAFFDRKIEVSISCYPHFRHNGVDAYYNNQTKNFDSIKENLFPLFEQNRAVNKVIIYDPLDHCKFSDILHVKLVNFADQYNVEKGNNEVFEKTNYILTINEDIKMSSNTIGVVTALPKEFGAMREVLDFDDLNFKRPDNDDNDYAVGYISTVRNEKVKVVIAMMKQMGNNNAASTTSNLLRSFTDVNEIIVCGIAGGVPHASNSERHVRLGDITVCNREGVLQYDSIKETDTEIKIRDYSSKPSAKLLGIVNVLISDYERNKKPWIEHLKKYEGKLRKSERPGAHFDILNVNGLPVEHPIDVDRVDNEPKVHHGAIGSSNTLLKNEVKRDFLRDNYNIIAVEMEGSGIADGTWVQSKGYLIVRGIVDYCNSDKNDEWHNYAAICAASYVKAIIEKM